MESKTFKKFLKSLVTESSYSAGEIVDSNPDNPIVLVKGMGKTDLNTLKNSTKKEIEDILKFFEVGDYKKCVEELDSKNILIHRLKALADISSKLEEKTEAIEEAAPPDEEIEKWIVDNKENFKKEYGIDWQKVLYALAWKKYKEKHE